MLLLGIILNTQKKEIVIKVNHSPKNKYPKKTSEVPIHKTIVKIDE